MKIGLAFRAFFNLLFGGVLSDEVITELGLTKKSVVPVKPAAPPPPARTTSDGALQILGILQRDSRLIDFLMEDISALRRRSDRRRRARAARPVPRCAGALRDAAAGDRRRGRHVRQGAIERSERREVRRQRPGQAAGGRHAAAQRLARRQGRPAGARRASRTPPSSRPRKSKSSKKTSEPRSTSSESISAPPTPRSPMRRLRRMPTRSRRPTCNCCPFRSW